MAASPTNGTETDLSARSRSGQSAWLCKLRLILHLLRGLAIVALPYRHADAARRARYVQRWSLQLLALCGISLRVHGPYDATAAGQGGELLVSNHISWLDIFAINAWQPTAFLSKAEVRQWPVLGWLVRSVGTVFIERESRRAAHRMVENLASRLRSAQSVAVFPEGTTSNGTGLLPFHANMFEAAVQAQVRVRPVALRYEHADGSRSQAPAFVGDTTLPEVVDAVCQAAPLVVHVMVGAAIDAVGQDRRALSGMARAAIAAALGVDGSACGEPIGAARSCQD